MRSAIWGTLNSGTLPASRSPAGLVSMISVGRLWSRSWQMSARAPLVGLPWSTPVTKLVWGNRVAMGRPDAHVTSGSEPHTNTDWCWVVSWSTWRTTAWYGGRSGWGIRAVVTTQAAVVAPATTRVLRRSTLWITVAPRAARGGSTCRK